MPMIDSHAHVFDLVRFPVQDSRGFDIAANEHGNADDYAAALDAHGVSHALLVNPLGGYGIDCSCMLATIAEGRGRFKGIALLGADATERHVKALIDGGVIGIRFNLNFEKSPSLYGAAGERALAIAREAGWLVQVHYEGDTLVPALPVLRTAGVPVVIDHMGRPDVAQGLTQSGFRALLELGREGAFVKLSAGFRSSRLGPPYQDLDPFVQALLQAFTARRCLWGSDWPFLRARRRVDYGPQLAALSRWVPDSSDRASILWDTPAALFGFSPRREKAGRV
jgi:predicted TIM-barrel fold metal-dependent hydrolase